MQRRNSLAESKRAYFYGTGRRKTAVARVRLYPGGDGTITVNGREVNQYFGRDVLVMLVRTPLHLLEQGGQFDVSARVIGGGVSGQAGAVRHGIARALVRADEENKPVMRRGGMLTRDPRMKERKKYGLKRARKAPQYTKR
ncbi:MAG TPA: 30S ribosomal protein S9 [Ktedonobacterales bacterium]|nr:30S ribosomal protein S9 [Ktedonobacterales bacterium]